MRIGVFDSGVGGLSVVKSLLDHHLFEEIIYFGDTARVPYGVKDQNTIIRYSLEALEFFKNFEIDLLITACNTVSAYALDEMRLQSTHDVIGVVDPGVLALKNAIPDTNATILILGTKATVKSGAYEKGLRALGYTNLSAIATSLLVPIVEEGLYEGAVLQSALDHYFGHLPHAPDAIILGCTHFPLVAAAINTYFEGKSTLIHSGEAIVEYLDHHNDVHPQSNPTQLKFFASENPEGLRKTAKEWLAL